MSQPTTGFVVRATARGGQSLWVSPPGADGLRTLVARDQAALFARHLDAHVAISKMPRVFEGRGYIFAVEVAD
jgi:hypothetical protein